jgi:hypothetical protein
MKADFVVVEGQSVPDELLSAFEPPDNGHHSMKVSWFHAHLLASGVWSSSTASD